MKIHREGKKIIFFTLGLSTLIVLLMLFLVKEWNVVHYLFVAGLVALGNLPGEFVDGQQVVVLV